MIKLINKYLKYLDGGDNKEFIILKYLILSVQIGGTIWIISLIYQLLLS